MLFLSAVLFLLLIVFFGLQTRTLLFERRYPLALAFFWGIALLSLANVVVAIRESSGLRWLVIIVSFGLLLIFGILGVAKLFLRDNWVESARRLLRTPSTLTLPHERFCVQASDGVSIRGYHVYQSGALKDKAVIIAHGGFRSKDIFVNHLLTAWLYEKYDVLAFDFRGHGESGGAITGDGKTVYDLKAVVDYAKEKGYHKLGVYGRSMGGWAAILEAADYQDVDAIVIAGMPPGYFSEVPEVSGRFNLDWLRFPGVPLLLRILTQVRWKHFQDVRRPIDEMDRVSPIPLLIIYNKADPAAGVDDETGFWTRVPSKDRPRRFRHIKALPFTAQQVYNRAQEPKELRTFSNAGHVYTLPSIRSLFTWIEEWFVEHLD